MTDDKPWAILTDLSGVVLVPPNEGGYHSKIEALEALHLHLRLARAEINVKLNTARRAISHIRKRSHERKTPAAPPTP